MNPTPSRGPPTFPPSHLPTFLRLQGAQRFKNNCFAVLRSSSKKGSYLRLVDFCITQLQAQSNREEEEEGAQLWNHGKLEGEDISDTSTLYIQVRS